MENTTVEQKATAEERKTKAIELMRKLDIYKPYIRGFKENNTVCFFENYAGYWVNQEPEIEAYMKKLEEEYNITVYAITHEFTEFGECFSFLYVNSYKEEWEYTLESYGNKHNAFAYVWNKSYDYDSEFGTVCVHSFGGGIRRIA
ncbi:MAG: hypothetical protein IJ398_04305 [Clostridia bacterium]|nr:hypothetical protein [Clostridia bacterium]